MIYSMTGFGRGEYSNDAFDITLEIKSVNNRYCDILVKMPKKLNVFEDRIKNTIKSHLSRGRIDVYINIEEKAQDNYEVVANYDILDKYVKVYREMISRYALDEDINIGMISRLQDGIDVSYKERAEEDYWDVIEPALNEAIERIKAMRKTEGEKLKMDVLEKVSHIEVTLSEIEKYSPQILAAYKQKTRERIKELLSELYAEIDENRIANELAIYADKTNINEEIVRIHSHLAQIKTILEATEPIGRKLDFLIQELNREANTMGSKSNDAELTRNVVALKAELEKIREQVQNIE